MRTDLIVNDSEKQKDMVRIFKKDSGFGDLTRLKN